MSLAVGQGRSNTPHPRSLEYRQQKVFGICFFTNILCLLLPSIHLSLLNSEVVSLLFHAAQKDLVQVLPCESKLQILQNPIGQLCMPGNLLSFRNSTYNQFQAFQPWLFHSFASVVTFPHFFNAKAAWLIREVKELCICGLRWLYCSYQPFPTARELAQHLCFGRRKEKCNDFLWGKIFSFLLETDSQL